MTSPQLLREARTLDQALRDRGIVRIECRDRQGNLSGIDRSYLLLAESEMRDLLHDALLPAPIGGTLPSQVTITGYLTRRQWSRALRLTDFAGADLVPAERRPEDICPSYTRRWCEVDWIKDPNLQGALTRRCTCELRARAAGRDFVVELVLDDLSGIPL